MGHLQKASRLPRVALSMNLWVAGMSPVGCCREVYRLLRGDLCAAAWCRLCSFGLLSQVRCWDPVPGVLGGRDRWRAHTHLSRLEAAAECCGWKACVLWAWPG